MLDVTGDLLDPAPKDKGHCRWLHILMYKVASAQVHNVFTSRRVCMHAIEKLVFIESICMH